VLRSFRLANHRSFRGEAELSLLPAYDKGRPAVPVAAIYGANAAGKSNLVDGLMFMRSAVRDSYRAWDPAGSIPRRPFRLDPAGGSQPSLFTVDLLLAGARYTYGFVVDDEVVREEWLYTYPKSRRRILFEREGTSIRLGESLGPARSKGEALAELTRPNALFLSLAAQVGLAEVGAVSEWFTRGGLVKAGDTINRDRRNLAAFMTGPFRGRLKELLATADTGINDVGVDTEELPRELAGKVESAEAALRVQLDTLAESARRAQLDTLAEQDIAMQARRMLGRGEFLLTEMETAREKYGTRPAIRFRHGPDVYLDLEDESAGTRAWIHALADTLTVLDGGGVLVVDEIDSSLHPNLTALLIQQFRSGETNPHGAQLIFTTHDATLLGTSFGEEVLARDEIWFVEKNAGGGSRLYPLTDFHPRTGENRERRYLGGSYGAVPVLGELGPAAPDHVA